jgi:hypothetical protein
VWSSHGGHVFHALDQTWTQTTQLTDFWPLQNAGCGVLRIGVTASACSARVARRSRCCRRPPATSRPSTSPTAAARSGWCSAASPGASRRPRRGARPRGPARCRRARPLEPQRGGRDVASRARSRGPHAPLAARRAVWARWGLPVAPHRRLTPAGVAPEPRRAADDLGATWRHAPARALARAIGVGVGL